MRANLLEASLLLSSILNIGLGLYALRQQRPRAEISGFALMALGMGGWVGSFALLSITHSFAFDKANHLSGLIFVLGLFIMSQVFPSGNLRGRKFLLAYLPFILAIWPILAGKIVDHVNFGPNGEVMPVQGSLFPVYGAFLIIYLIWSLTLFIRKYRQTIADDRMRMKYFFSGIVIFVLGAAIGDILLPAIGFPLLNFLGPLASVAFIALTAVAIVRHRLLDIRIIFERGLIYSLLAVILCAVYAALLGLVSLSVGYVSPVNTMVVAGITMLVGVFTGPDLEKWLCRKTDKVFFKGRYDHSEALRTLSELLSNSAEPENIISKVETALSAILRSEPARLIVLAEDLVLTENHIDFFNPRIPIVSNNREIGTLMPGLKKSRDAYTPEDIKMLETFALHAATSFERIKMSRKQKLEHEILANISHNLQTPLTVIQTKLDQLRSAGKFGAEAKSFESSLSHLSNFIYDTLKLSRLENTPSQIQERFSLSDAIRDSVEEIDVIARASQVELRSSIDKDIFINGDRRQIVEAFMNIASNAIKCVKKHGNRRIFIELKSQGPNAILSVSDTGPGISEKEIEHIFDRYSKVSKHGTGLGLALAKQVVENHKGTINIESALNKGTRVILTLPMVS